MINHNLGWCNWHSQQKIVYILKMGGFWNETQQDLNKMVDMVKLGGGQKDRPDAENGGKIAAHTYWLSKRECPRPRGGWNSLASFKVDIQHHYPHTHRAMTPWLVRLFWSDTPQVYKTRYCDSVNWKIMCSTWKVSFKIDSNANIKTLSSVKYMHTHTHTRSTLWGVVCEILRHLRSC